MKLIEILRDSNILKEDNLIEIDEAVLMKYSKKLSVSFVLDNAVDLATYNSLSNKIHEILKPLGINIEISIGYKNEELSNEEYFEYLKEILKVLTSQSARFKALNVDDCKINGNNITFLVAYDALGFESILKPIADEFSKYGINVNLNIMQDQNKSVQAQINALDKQIDEALDKQRQEALAAAKFNNEIKNQKRQYGQRNSPAFKTSIKNIPSTRTGLEEYKVKNGFPSFMVEAYVFGIEIKSFAKTKSNLATIKVTDETDSIVVKKWLRSDTEKQLYENEITNNVELRIIGNAEYDEYAKDVILAASSIEVLGRHKEDDVVDDAPVKRVELHAHTKMSTLDGLTDAKDYVSLVSKWGWNAMAFTDHNGVYAIPDVNHAIEKLPDFKPIYGTELSYVNDEKYFITFDKRDINLKDSTYVVFDIETTGLSQTYDEIIEIAACKVRNGTIIDNYEVFVNPKIHIPEKITELTTITDDMVKDAKAIDEILPEFFEFCGDSILVAHNAKFDVGMIYRDVKRLGLDVDMLPVIDTLNLFRAGYYDAVKTFNLKSLSKYFKVKQEQHHRAIDDTRVTALCFIQMLNDLYAKNIYNYGQINSIIDPNVHYKHVIPSHIVILAKTQQGYKNMFKIVSDAMTNHFYGGNARALKSVIDKYRDGILLGSACVNGNVFELALNRSEEELEEEMAYYDYIEVQPPLAYKQLYNDMPSGEERVKEIILKIIRIAKKLNKIVVATSDCHYARPRLKKYRDILIATPQIGGGTHPLSRYEDAPDLHLRTTNEMLEEFEFLGKELAYEIVVTNTNLIASSIDKWPAFKPDMFAPRDDEFKNSIINVPSIEEEMKRIVNATKVRLYGENAHPIVEKRISRELNSIISNGYASVYYICHLMVSKSLSDGYLVGSRGSVGSSLIATMMNISEINPLAPHYRCKKCKFHTFRMREDEIQEFGLTDIEKPFQDILRTVDSGYDLPDAKCPICGEPLAKDGHDIPFETFLGFNGDKIPDIGLNFSGEYQAIAHEYIRSVFGPENSFRAGTVGTVADNTAFGYVKGYCERKNISLRSCEMERIGTYLVGIKRSTGQHPGGIVVVPHYVDIYDVTPVQYPADNIENNWRTTHFDYHSFEQNLLKFDVLGHDDPTLIKYFMDYVHEHQADFPFENPQDIPIDDKNLYRLFYDPSVIGVTCDDIDSKVASYAVPELGTNFVRNMLVETLPKTFAQLVKISGLSHGTDVWNNNAQELVNGSTEFGKIEFKDIIGCRDDIMVDLLRYGLEPLTAFKIMEFVRKGKVAKDPEGWSKFRKAMEEKNVPEWYIWSCEKIKYMFPKAHATAYCMMSLRIAWFKVYSPALFYSAWFSKRAKNHSVSAYLGGRIAIKAAMEEIKNKQSRSGTDDDKYVALQVALEMTARGIKFLPVDIMKSSATIFEIEDGNLRIPFVAVDSLGESIAVDIVEKREEKPFTSKKDVLKRTRLNNTLYEEFNIMHAFGNLPEEDKEVTEGIFAFM